MAGSSLKGKHVSIIGTGNYGAALGKRLVQHGYDVTYGSRRPSTRNMVSVEPLLGKANVVHIDIAIQNSNIVIFAVRVSNFKTIAETYSTLLKGKIVVDVSNRTKDVKTSDSNAEYLQSLLPDAFVVKAFNVISAYTLESELDDSTRTVPIASEEDSAKEVVSKLVTSLGFSPKDGGKLSASREIESSVLEVLPLWRFPALLALIIFSVSWLYIVYLYYIRIDVVSWEMLFLRILNKPLAMTSVNLFALTYLPGCLAAILQLYHGTKHKRFPHWLDYWMRRRKQLGLVAFTFAAMHVLVSTMLLAPSTYSSWFQKTRMVIHANSTKDMTLVLPVRAPMNWKGGVNCLTGTVSFFIYCILAATSLPSVGRTLNWAEWRFVQSTLGHVGLFTVVAHAYFMGMPGWIKHSSNLVKMLQSIAFTSTILAVVVLALKFFLLLPGVRGRLRKIRRGWERSCNDTRSHGVEQIEVECLK